MDTQTLGQGKREKLNGALRRVVAGAIFLTLTTASFPQAKQPLTAENLMELLSGGVAVSRVTFLVLDRGVDFAVTPKFAKALEDAGADPALLAAIRKSGPGSPSHASSVSSNIKNTSQEPPTGLTVHSQPGGAAIYIDGDLKGETDAQEGSLQIAPLKPGKHRLRASLQGYDDVEGPAVVVAGELAEVPVTLAPSEAPPAPKVEELPAGKKFLVRHLHRAVEGASGPPYCQGWMIVNVGYVRYISTNSPHKYMMGTSEIRDVKGSGAGFTVKLDFGRKYDFVAVDDKGNEVSAGPVLSEIRYSMGQ